MVISEPEHKNLVTHRVNSNSILARIGFGFPTNAKSYKLVNNDR